MRPAGLIPSFSLIGLRSPAPSTREGRGARAALPFLLGLRLAPQPYETTVDALLSPARGLQAPACFFQDAWPRPPPRRSVSASTVECSSAHITRGLIHPLVSPALPFGSTCARVSVRSWSPLARDPAPANWGPVFLRTRDVRHRGCQGYAGRRFCLENKLCATCANKVEIESAEAWVPRARHAGLRDSIDVEVAPDDDLSSVARHLGK